jgi:hypothetical protein
VPVSKTDLTEEIFDAIKYHFQMFGLGVYLFVGINVFVLPWFGMSMANNSSAVYQWSTFVGCLVMFNWWEDV